MATAPQKRTQVKLDQDWLVNELYAILALIDTANIEAKDAIDALVSRVRNAPTVDEKNQANYLPPRASRF